VNEDELRALVRSAIQKHLGAQAGDSRSAFAPPQPAELRRIDSLSFSQYRLERAPDDTMCLIEPAVRCNHCGFCKCHGH
jgi:hypothetical protein